MNDVRRLSHEEATELAGLYVLDALEPADEAAVREHLATCDLAHPEFAEVGGVVPALAAQIQPLDAPPALRDRVLAAVAATPQADATVATAAGPTLHAASEPISLEAERERRRGRPWWQTALAAAAVLLIVVLAGLNLLQYQRASEADQRAALLRDALAATADPTSQVARLEGVGPAAGARGFAAIPAQGTGYVVIEGLTPAPSGQTYQAWYLVGGTPTSAGLMTVGTDGLMLSGGLQPVPGTDTIALTIEQAGGVPAPTGDPVVVGALESRAAAGVGEVR